MFDEGELSKLLRSQDIRNAAELLIRLQDQMAERFHDANDAAEAMALAIGTGAPLLFIGPPGVAKSKMIGTLCELTNVKPPPDADAREDGTYFEYLLTQFTEPSELFGELAMEGGTQGAGIDFVRRDKGMMHRSRIVFLDEVFKGSSAILNSLLSFMNEGVFHDRGQVKPVLLDTLFAATNEVPERSELRAVYDRFVFRVCISEVDTRPGDLAAILTKAWSLPERAHSDSQLGNLFEAVGKMRKRIQERRGYLLRDPPADDPALRALSHVVTHARDEMLGLFSTRRLVKLTEAMLVARLMRAAREGWEVDARIGLPELSLAWRFFLDPGEPIDPDQLAQFKNVPITVFEEGA